MPYVRRKLNNYSSFATLATGWHR